jgi:hypothetical protein
VEVPHFLPLFCPAQKLAATETDRTAEPHNRLIVPQCDEGDNPDDGLSLRINPLPVMHNRDEPSERQQVFRCELLQLGGSPSVHGKTNIQLLHR